MIALGKVGLTAYAGGIQYSNENVLLVLPTYIPVMPAREC